MKNKKFCAIITITLLSLLFPQTALALTDTTPQLIQWASILLASIVFILFVVWLIAAIRKKMSYKRSIISFIIFLILFGWPAAYGIYHSSIVKDPCNKKTGWENTPCTYDHSPVSDGILEKAKNNSSQNWFSIASWDTEYGRIYAVGASSNDGKIFSLLGRPAFAQIDVASDSCESRTGVTDGSYATFSNAYGETIAHCDIVPKNDGWNDMRICSWLESLDPNTADYADPDCRNK